MCSFCDQFKITGVCEQPSGNYVINIINNSIRSFCHSKLLDNKNFNRQIAFFGGSFTAIKKEYMEELLSAAYTYVKSGEFMGIRISTRPDCIDRDILNILKSYGVTSIELGAQSMDDEVLKANNRGHNAEDVINASKLIKSYGFELGLQMMTNLYKSNNYKDIYTAKEFIDLNPSTVRIYPTITMKGTLLEKLYYEDKYTPMMLDEAVLLCSDVLKLFTENNINVIKLGLHSSKSINENFVAGPWHPAFRELCEGRNLYIKCEKTIYKLGLENRDINIFVNPIDVSKIIGQNKSGLRNIKKICSKIKILSDENVLPGNLRVEG